MIPALKIQKEDCQLFQGSPVLPLKPATHTHKPPKETNKHKRKEKKKRKKDVQRRSVEIQKFRGGSERYRGDNNWYRAGGKRGPPGTRIPRQFSLYFHL